MIYNFLDAQVHPSVALELLPMTVTLPRLKT